MAMVRSTHVSWNLILYMALIFVLLINRNLIGLQLLQMNDIDKSINQGIRFHLLANHRSLQNIEYYDKQRKNFDKWWHSLIDTTNIFWRWNNTFKFVFILFNYNLINELSYLLLHMQFTEKKNSFICRLKPYTQFIGLFLFI